MVPATPIMNVKSYKEFQVDLALKVMEFVVFVSDLFTITSAVCLHNYFSFSLVAIRCGQQSSENCTYFQSSGTEQGACNAKICAKPGVCQLRLDFPKFAIGM